VPRIIFAVSFLGGSGHPARALLCPRRGLSFLQGHVPFSGKSNPILTIYLSEATFQIFMLAIASVTLRNQESDSMIKKVASYYHRKMMRESTDYLYRLHTAILDRPLSSAATKEV
jgi:hypothetical protein